MKRIIVMAVLSASTLSGCGTMGYMMGTYGATSDAVRSDFDYQDSTYRIFDRKDLSKVMITSSLGDAALHGAARGATFGGVNIDDDQTRFSSATSAYLVKDRPMQSCKVLDGKLLMTPQWEFVYLCADKLKS